MIIYIYIYWLSLALNNVMRSRRKAVQLREKYAVRGVHWSRDMNVVSALHVHITTTRECRTVHTEPKKKPSVDIMTGSNKSGQWTWRRGIYVDEAD